MDMDRRWSRLRLTHRHRSGRYAPGDRVLTEEPCWRERGERAAAVERPVRSTLNNEFDYAARVRQQHADCVWPGKTVDRLYRRQSGREVGRGYGLGESADQYVVQQRRARRR